MAIEKTNVDIARDFARTFDADGFFVPPVVLLEQFIISVREGRIKELTADKIGPANYRIKIGSIPEHDRPNFHLYGPDDRHHRCDVGGTYGDEFVRIHFENPDELRIAKPCNENTDRPADTPSEAFEIVNEKIDEAARQVAEAWNVEGRVPQYHASAQKHLLTRWPVLGKAVRKLAVAMKALDDMPRPVTPGPALPAARNDHGLLCSSRDGSEFCNCGMYPPDQVIIRTFEGERIPPKDPPPGNYYVDPTREFIETPAGRICDRCKKEFFGGAQITPTGVYCSEDCAHNPEGSTTRPVMLSAAVDLELDPVENCSICKTELHASDGFTLLNNAAVIERRFCPKCAFQCAIDAAFKAGE